MVNSATCTTDHFQVWKIIWSFQHKVLHTKEKQKLKHFKHYFKNLYASYHNLAQLFSDLI